MKIILPVLCLCLLVGCSPEDGNPAPDEDVKTYHQDWIGKWIGPEGTYLILEEADNDLNIIIANLDGPRTFAAEDTDQGIAFERDGVQETITHGTGFETGMKWLSDKKDCLIVKAGEGYCRD